jgi:hypothetical protein
MNGTILEVMLLARINVYPEARAQLGELGALEARVSRQVITSLENPIQPRIEVKQRPAHTALPKVRLQPSVMKKR